MQRRKETEMDKYGFKIVQNGIVVASGSGPDVDAVGREAMHYAMIYGQDGPVAIKCRGFTIETDGTARRGVVLPPLP